MSNPKHDKPDLDIVLALSVALLVLGGMLLLARTGHDLLLKIVFGIIGFFLFILGFFFVGGFIGAFGTLAVYSVFFDFLELIVVPLVMICFSVGGILLLYYFFEEYYKDKPEQKAAIERVFRAFRKCLGILSLAVAAAVLVICIWNIVMLNREKDIIQSPGELIELDKHNKMSVYTEGEGEHTLVFLSGSGTAEPILDFKGLYSKLSNEYRIVVIERLGYGFSSKYVYRDKGRTVSMILYEYRQALEAAGIEGPYILCAHSMSGLHAIRWAQEYPDEVEAVVGLDMCVPDSYSGFDLKRALWRSRFGAAGRILGIARLFYQDRYLPDTLSPEEKALYRAVACRVASNDTVRAELRFIPDSVEAIGKKDIPDIPTVLFCSDGTETGIEGWTEIQDRYASSLSNSKVIKLDCGHYLHNEQPERIAEEIKEFIETALQAA